MRTGQTLKEMGVNTMALCFLNPNRMPAPAQSDFLTQACALLAKAWKVPGVESKTLLDDVTQHCVFAAIDTTVVKALVGIRRVYGPVPGSALPEWGVSIGYLETAFLEPVSEQIWRGLYFMGIGHAYGLGGTHFTMGVVGDQSAQVFFREQGWISVQRVTASGNIEVLHYRK